MTIGIVLILCCVGTSLEFHVENTVSTIFIPYEPPDLEQLDLNELLKEALQNKEKRKKANKLYKTEYGDVLVTIDDTAEYLDNVGVIHFNYDLAENYFKAFGPSIEKLRIAYHNITEDKHKDVGRLVNYYCSDTLLQLTIQSCKNGVFDGVQKPFKKVKIVTLNGVWTDPGPNFWTLNKIFPEVRSLSLNYPGGDVYNQHYKNLKKLIIYVPTPNDFTEIIEKNPQIEELRLKETSMEVLKTVSKTLHKLKNLEFNVPSNSVSYQGSAIQLEGIKIIKINDDQYKTNAKKFKFKQVEELTLILSKNVDDEYVELIGGLKELKTLKASGGKFNKLTFSKLSKSLSSQCKYIYIEFDSSVDAESICKFLDSNKQLFTLQFICPDSKSLFKQLHDKLNKEWRDISIHRDYVKISDRRQSQASTAEPQSTSDLQHSNDPTNDSQVTADPQGINDPQNTNDSQGTDNSQGTTESTIVQNTSTTTNTNNDASNIYSNTILTLAVITIFSHVFVF